YIKRNASLQAIAQKPFFGTVLFWSLFLSPLVLIPLAVLFGRKRKAHANDVAGKRRRRADRLARKYLSEARKNLGNQKEFYISMERALHNYLKAKLHITTSEMSKEHVSNLLKEKGAKEETTDNFIDILKNCEFARYAPSSNVEMKKDYKKAAEVISALDKQL
ncbi:MAG TPA: protein BatD, partial [Salinimicrobium sp.]|nr:protein BatD [Salinimicrobium sp.]